MSNNPDAILLALLRSACDVGAGIAGCSTYKGRRIVTAQCPGFAPVSQQTQIEIASITKVFTGMLLVNMAREGIVRLDEPISDILLDRDLPDVWSSISLLDLACHRSGLPKLPPNFNWSPWDPYCDWGRDELYHAMRNVRLYRSEFEPAFRYSNFGFAILTEALSHRACLSYGALVTRRLLQPLRLTSTVPTSALEAPRCPAYNCAGEPTNTWDFNAMTGAGGLSSTAEDLLLLGETLLAVEHSSPNPAQRHGATFDGSSYGIGWSVSHFGQTTVIWTSGGVAGSASFLGLLVKERVVVTALLNSGIPNNLTKAGFAALSYFRDHFTDAERCDV